MKPLKIKPEIRFLLQQALREDLGRGDVTTRSLVPKGARGVAQIIAKEEGIFCGGPVAQELFKLRDRALRVKCYVREGAWARKGQRVVTISGRLQPILEAERVVLNVLGRLSGIATLTRQFVDKIRDTGAKIYDTRKTTPLLRVLEKYAVRSGGGENHRFGLWDEVLVKENHWDVVFSGASLREDKRLLRALRALAMTKKRYGIPVEVEVRTLKELAHLLEGTFTPDRVLLDNFSTHELKRAVLFVRGFYQLLRTRYGIKRRPPELEASGGVNLANVHQIAQTGVDRISVGRLTHSAASLDFSLTLEK
jgi:nicotinate-nucleotide pyrophosphorylase (carboxylating)